MTANTRRGGAEDLQLLELGADPAPPAADTLIVYAKDVNGAAELFMINDVGAVSALTPRLMPLTTTTSARAVGGAAFQISAARTALVSYTIRVEFSGGDGGHVELLVGAADPPTADRGRVGGGGAGFVEASLTTIVSPGHFVLLQAVDEVGTPTYTITAQTEQTF